MIYGKVIPIVSPPTLPLKNAITEICGKNLIGYWPGLNRSSQAWDYSGRGNHLAISGASYQARGGGGNSFGFDGVDDYLYQQSYASKVGTVTASMANGVAFINDSGQNFNPFVGVAGSLKQHMIVATDSAGKKAWGYIGERGTGETYEDIVNSTAPLLNGGFETAGAGGADVFANWVEYVTGTSTVNDEASVVHGGAHSCRIDIDASNSVARVSLSCLVDGYLYKSSGWFKVNDATGAPNIRVSIGTSIATITLTTDYAKTELYGTANSDPAVYITRNATCNSKSIYADDITVQKVLTPTSTGVKIYSTKTGSTQNWAGMESGFLPNAISSYEIRKTDFNITGALTIGAWVKTSDTVGIIVSKANNYNVGNQYELTLDSAGKYWFAVGKNDGAGITFNSASLTGIDTTVWNHVVGVYIPSVSVTLYLNGVQVAQNTTAITASVYDSNEPVRIGKNGAGVHLAGSIADSFICDRNLSRAEVEAIFDEGKP